MVEARNSSIVRWSRWARLALLSVVFWSAIALAFVLPMLGHGADLRKMVFGAFAQWWSWGLLLPLILAIDRALPFTGKQLGRRIAAHLLLGPLVALLYSYVLTALHALLGLWPWQRILGRGVVDEAVREMFWSMLVYAVIVGASMTYRYQQQYLSAELHMERLERTSSEARLQAIRMQLDPHFLFNALNTVSAQVEREPKLARRMIEHLGDLLRLSLETHGRQEVTLAEELNFLEHYLAIQAIRFGDTMRFEQSITPEVRSAMVPSMILQPLVENAIRHGISKRIRGGVVELQAHRLEERLVLRVLDDGVGLPDGWLMEKQTGLGLALTRERIAVLHPGENEVAVRRRAAGGTEVVVSFKLRMGVAT